MRLCLLRIVVFCLLIGQNLAIFSMEVCAANNAISKDRDARGRMCYSQRYNDRTKLIVRCSTPDIQASDIEFLCSYEEQPGLVWTARVPGADHFNELVKEFRNDLQKK